MSEFEGKAENIGSHRIILSLGPQRTFGRRLAALANKMARIAWTVLAQERSYEARVTKAAA